MTCPLCRDPGRKDFVASILDTGTGTGYTMFRCAACAVRFAHPFEHPGVEWYQRFSPGEDTSGMSAWRYRFAFRAPLGPRARVLDVGCGPGMFLAMAAARGFETTGLDFDPKMLESARSRGLRDLYCEDLTGFHTRTPRGSYDLVTFFDVLEHLPDPGRALEMGADLLKPGGHIAVTVPNYWRPLLFGRDAFDLPPHHLTWWTPPALRAFVERHGFETIWEDHGRYRVWESSRMMSYPMAAWLVEGFKRCVFGVSGAGSPTVTEIIGRPQAPKGFKGRLVAFLKEKRTRHRIVNAVVFSLHAATFPVFGALTLVLKAARPDGGMTIRLLARKT